MNIRTRNKLIMAALAGFLAIGAVFASSDAVAQATGSFADKQATDNLKRRACEQNLPSCLPQVRRQLEQEARNQMWMGGMIVGVLALVGLVAYRTNQKKQKEEKKLIARGKEMARKRKAKQEEQQPPGRSRRSRLEHPPGFGSR